MVKFQKKKDKFILNAGGGTLLTLFSLFLFGIGYSSWNIIEDNKSFFDINVGVGNLINLDNYFTTPKVDHFQISPAGIVTDETITYSGKIKITTNLLLKSGLVLDYKELKNSITFKFEIVNKGSFNFFSEQFMGSTNPNIDYAFYEKGQTPTYSTVASLISDNLISSKATYTNDNIQNLDYISIDLVYSFDFTNYKTDFKTQVYDKLGNNPLTFDLNIGII